MNQAMRNSRRRLRWLVLLVLLMAAAAQAGPVFWLDKDYKVVDQDEAVYKATIGARENGVYPIAFDAVDDGGRIYRAFIDRPDYSADDAHFIGQYTLYRDDDHTRKETGQHDDQGRFDGVITTYRRNGAVKHKNEYAHGKRNGTSRFFDEEGRLDTATEYVDGKREGVKKTFVQGHLYWLKHFHDDVQEGVAEKYLHVGDKQVLAARTHYHDGRPDGWFRFYSAGHLEHEIHYRAGKAEGTARYYVNGTDQLRKIEHYAAGKRVGTWREYTAAGKPYEEKVYADDGSEKIVEQSRFNPRTGALESHDYRLGQDDARRRISARYDNHGYLHQRTTRYLNIRRRIRIEFAEDGRLTYLLERRDGQKVGRYVRPAGGGEIEHGRFDANGHRQGEATRTDRRGNRVAVLHYERGRRDGEYTGYDEHGQMIEHGQYRDNKRVGRWRLSEPGSGLIWRGRYQHARRAGHWEAKNGQGQLVAAGDYDDRGLQDGVWVVYDDHGQLKNCPRYDHGKRGDTPDFDAADTPSAAAFCRDRLPDWAEPQV